MSPSDSAEFLEDHAADRAGRRIRKIRMEQGLSQSELGDMVDLNANRIQQYENGARRARLDLTKKIATALGVDTMALVDPSASHHIGVMYTLFEMEELWDLQLKNIDGKIHLCFGKGPYSTKSAAINDYLEQWYKIQSSMEDAMDAAMTDEEKKKITHDYNMWEWTFPKALVQETEDNLKKIRTQAQRQDRIKKLREELEALEAEEDLPTNK